MPLLLVLGSTVVAVGSPESLAAVSNNGSFPSFSWDRVPLYQMFGDGGRLLTDKEVAEIASTSNFICIEKNHATRTLGGAEIGAKKEFSRFKAVNPATKGLFYFNSAYAYAFTTPSEIFRYGKVSADHQAFLLKDPETGKLYNRGKVHFFDVLNPDFRTWWTETVGQCVKESGADGLFVDQMHGFAWLRSARSKDVRESQVEMMRMAKNAIGPDKILLLNNGAHIPELFEIGDAFMFEHYNAKSLTKESILKEWTLMKEISDAGKISVWRIGVKVEEAGREKTGGRGSVAASYFEELSKKRIEFYLAAFLIGAQPDSYFQYGWGWKLETGPLVKYPEFKKPLGKPMGDATRPDPAGWIFKREFEHAKVWLDLSERRGKVDWK
ncbi:putative glycoside hydrolase [Haloferula sp.]|uniref:putative glycoside hydrolase n=1 Tax=Haloferula sp. TaxID=2497595 RepID=UPI00329D5E35